MYKLANSLFFDLLHKTTVQRGLDPRRFALFSFGGTAGMHVGAYGEDLGVSHDRDPATRPPSTAPSASSPPTSRTRTRSPSPLRAPFDVGAIAGDLTPSCEARIDAQLEAEGFEREPDAPRSARSTCATAARCTSSPSPFVGDDVSAESLEQTIELFERLYGEKYGPQSAYREAGIELVSFRVRGVGVVRKPEFHVEALGDEDAVGCARRARRGLGGQGRRARGGSRLRLRAAATRATPFAGPGDRLDADHDARRRARSGGAAGRAPKPRRLGWRLRST